MPDSTSIEDWEAKAARAREAADQMVKPGAVRIMLELAKFYDVLASEARDYGEASQSGNDIVNAGAILPLPQHDPAHHSRVAQYATEAEAMAHRHRLDRLYRVHAHGKVLWSQRPPPTAES